jgi:aryl-alcohol dehydrogenase (NADP+)
VTLDDDVLDAIDAVVEPGHDLNPADTGWAPPSLRAEQRR